MECYEFWNFVLYPLIKDGGGESREFSIWKDSLGCSVENRCEKFQEATWDPTALVQLRLGSILKQNSGRDEKN